MRAVRRPPDGVRDILARHDLPIGPPALPQQQVPEAHHIRGAQRDPADAGLPPVIAKSAKIAKIAKIH